MKYYLPDAQDLVDPSFDFLTERRSRTRLRQRDDLYLHETFAQPACDGILVSKGIVDGYGNLGSRYTLAQRQRLLREGGPAFLRTQRPDGRRIPVMGDCGAFTYVKEEIPPYSVEEVISFYGECGFDYGISVDHVILAYEADLDGAAVPDDFRKRQAITLDLARLFLAQSRTLGDRFTPMGVAQGWSPKSYAHAVSELQKMGYANIAVGGMVPLKTPEIVAILRGIATVRRTSTELHLLGVTRADRMQEFASLGVTSFDSTSPLRQAFKDDKDNFYTLDRTFVAIRIPQIDGNPKMMKGIQSGKIPHDRARKLEREALEAMRDFDVGNRSVDATINAVCEYERLYNDKADYADAYRETLKAKPWKACSCEICERLGHHVILFRGAERNRRRGFHNVWTFYRRLQRDFRGSHPPTLETRARRSLKAQSELDR
jgi:hypothetical protein